MKKLFVLGLLLCSLCVARADIHFFIYMNGFEETPPNASPAAGGGVAAYNPITGELSLSVFFVGLTAPVTFSHVHLGPPGVMGPPIVDTTPFSPPVTAGAIVTGPIPFPAIHVPALLAGDTYFNIHTAAFPGGEIRGQLNPVPEPSAFALGVVGLGALTLMRRRLIRA
jgi:MYXO-CTERM domain-containing protein